MTSVLTSYTNASLIKSGNTGDSAELIGTVPINGATQIIFSLDLNADNNLIKLGDLVVADCSFEGTNNTGVDVGWGGRLILGTSAGSIGGTEISEASGRNITPDMHHDTLVYVGNVIVADESRHYLNALITAQSTGTSSTIIIGDGSSAFPADYGRMSYQVHRQNDGLEFQPDFIVSI